MASAQRSSTKSMLPAQPIGVHRARIDGERRIDGLARGGVVARVEQHAGERRQDLADRAAGTHARCDMLWPRPESPLSRYARRATIARAGPRSASAPMLPAHSRIGGRLRLGQRVFGLPQLRRSGRHAQVRACASFCSSRARSSSGMVVDSCSVGGAGGRQLPAGERRRQRQRVFQAEAFNPLMPPRSERHSRESPASAAGRLRRRCACRWRRSAGSARRESSVAASVSSLDMGRCSAARRQRIVGALARIAHVHERESGGMRLGERAELHFELARRWQRRAAAGAPMRIAIRRAPRAQPLRVQASPGRRSAFRRVRGPAGLTTV